MLGMHSADSWEHSHSRSHTHTATLTTATATQPHRHTQESHTATQPPHTHTQPQSQTHVSHTPAATMISADTYNSARSGLLARTAATPAPYLTDGNPAPQGEATTSSSTRQLPCRGRTTHTGRYAQRRGVHRVHPPTSSSEHTIIAPIVRAHSGAPCKQRHHDAIHGCTARCHNPALATVAPRPTPTAPPP